MAKQQAAEKAAQEKAAKIAAQKKAAKQKIEKEKAEKLAAKKKEEQQKAKTLAQQKAAKEKAAREAAAKRKALAEKRAKEAAIKAKKAEEAAKLAAISAPSLSLSSFDDKQQAAAQAADKAALDAATQAFIAAVTAKVWSGWIMPQGVPDNLHAKVFIRLDKKGNISDVRITERSGNRLYDNSVLTAVRAAAPLPMPNNTELLKILLKEGVELNF